MNKLLIPFFILLLFSCSDKPADKQPTLAVSIEPLRYIVESVAGNQFRVVTMMPQGASPETYEPSPRQMMELSESKAIFRVGTLGFECTQLPQMVEAAQKVPLIDLNQDITPIIATCHTNANEQSMDPHIWMSAENLRTMAYHVFQELCRIDSMNAPLFKERLEKFVRMTDSLDTDIKKQLSPLQNRSFLIYHPALGYFAKQYGLNQIAVEHNGKEPSVANFEQIINNCKAEKVKVVFISEEHVGRPAQRVAEVLKARVVSINPLSYNVAAQMRFIAKQLSNE